MAELPQINMGTAAQGIKQLNSIGRVTGTRQTAEGGSFKSALMTAAGSLESIFDTASKTYGVSKKLLMAVAKQESNFNTNAVSSAGARGVMQLMPETAAGLGVTDPFDPYQNIMAGARLLRDNIKKFGSVPLALAAYNAGPAAVKKYNGIPPYKETQSYVKNITAMLGDGDASIKSSYRYAGAQQSGYTMNGLYSSDIQGIFSLRSSSLDGMGLSGLLSYGGISLLNSSGNAAAAGLDSLLSDMRAERAAAAGDGDSVTLDRQSFLNLIELLRIRMLMGSSSIGKIGEI